MSKNSYPVTNGDQEPNAEEMRDRIQAVANVHEKIVRAQLIDQVLEVNGTQQSYPHAQVDVQGGAEDLGRHITIRLIPPSDLAEDAHIVSLELEVPTKTWLTAGQLLKQAHTANLDQNMPGGAPGIGSQARYVPTFDVVGDAYNANGDRLSFYLSPKKLQALESRADVMPAPLHENLDGIYFSTPEHPYAEELQAEMLSNWLTPQSLKQMIAVYEPEKLSGGHVSGQVAS